MKKWKITEPDDMTVKKIASGCGVSPLAAAVLVAKGYSLPESVMESFENNQLSDPFLIKDMQKAVEVINEAIDENKLICVYGDYDCDGIMSSVILYTYLLECGANVMYYIPERSEGYGLNKDAITSIHENGANLIITVDNGISAISEADYIYSLGMKLVITDHHQQGEQLPRAEAIVDPHRHDCLSPFKYACGAVIALKLVAALNDGDYTSALEQFGDLAAMATIADVVPLVGENRFIAAYGLGLINNTDRPALMALKKVAALDDKKVNSKSVGFMLAPRINAAGRINSPKTAMKLFLCEDYDEALIIAEELDELNTARKNAENEIVEEIYRMVDADPSLIRERTIFMCGKNWHHGVIGIVASKIQEKFGKPCFIASEENGEIRGSARSFGSFSIFDALTYAADSLEKFGGHPGAGGFTIKSGMAEEFRRLINEYAFKNHRVMPVLETQAGITVLPHELTLESIQSLDVLEPFGEGNEKPLFCIRNALIIDLIPRGNGNTTSLKLRIGNTFHDAIMFNMSPDKLPVKCGEFCDIIAVLEENSFRGNVSLKIKVEDIRPHGFAQDKYFAALNVFEAFLRNEEIPQNYYAAMLPSRDMAAMVYKHIPDSGISTETLYVRLIRDLNYCRFCVAVEAMKQLGFIKVSYTDSIITRVKEAPRADINSAPILVSLREKISGNK